MATKKDRFTTTGLHCPSCSMLVQMEVGDLDGVVSVASDHRSGVTEVEYDPSVVTPDDIVAAVVKVGYAAEPVED